MNKIILKLLRKSHRLSQEELAKLSGLNISRIVYLEKDFNRAKSKDKKAIAKALNISIDLLA